MDVNAVCRKLLHPYGESMAMDAQFMTIFIIQIA